MAAATLRSLLTGSHSIPGVAAMSIIAFIGLQCLDIASDAALRVDNVANRAHLVGASSQTSLSLHNIVFCHVGKARGNTF